MPDKPGENRLTILEVLPGGTCKCRCTCGVEKVFNHDNVRRGRSRSCGCLRKQVTANRSRTHGLTGSPEHVVWWGIVSRCRNPGNTSYKDYGAKGIEVCKRWQGLDGFRHFLSDMGPRPEGMTIERKDSTKGYSPSNCVWATVKTQGRNRSTNRLLTYDGRTQCLSAWAEEMGVPYKTLWYRLTSGWSEKRALTEPVKTR